MDQTDYQRRYDALVERYENAKQCVTEIDAQIARASVKILKLSRGRSERSTAVEDIRTKQCS